MARTRPCSTATAGSTSRSTPASQSAGWSGWSWAGCWRGPTCAAGGEYGEAWHQAGMLANKQNVFDDFIACAEYLVGERITCPARLAIMGGSNGGLLVGAAMTQRPDLFAAAVPAGGRAWICCASTSSPSAGRGSATTARADDPEEFKTLYAYSPLHNLRPGVAYPATLVTTADHDDRVVPGHSFKFAAALQACAGRRRGRADPHPDQSRAWAGQAHRHPDRGSRRISGRFCARRCGGRRDRGPLTRRVASDIM